jgi:hypothetical protein
LEKENLSEQKKNFGIILRLERLTTPVILNQVNIGVLKIEKKT